MADEERDARPLSSEVESAARALIEVLARGLTPSSSSGTGTSRSANTPITEHVRLSGQSGLTPLPIPPGPEDRVRQAMKRWWGAMKLSVIPTDSDGYSARLLKSVSNNGKNMLFVVPLQEQLAVEPLPFDSVEFAKMPQSTCMKCCRKIPLPLLPLHIEECKNTQTECETDVTVLDDDDEDDDKNVSEAVDQPSTLHTDSEQSSQICPICQMSFPTDILHYHASMCGERELSFSGIETPSTSTRDELPGPSTAQSPTSLSAAWKNEIDPQKASRMFCEELLSQSVHCPALSLLLNQFDTEDEQDSTLISFYKMNSANWSAPLKCRLTGDAAVGKGVNRHVFSLIMQKLKSGFTLNLGM
ncbi:hypothetical protein IRJ41_009459 [Triplophysa rosa]|uniref:Uncharacterized protein n=1 Tax=Triplophysa rosa TaxID=992332 RepID=A0A9W7TLX8_TRIRA|nr:hypothetical protein IRJ41_009459 [Triplophysa rosa]